MKKKIIAISIITLIIASIPLVVKAHPGRTDSRGGHTNRSTGEYHYHHGQSAHDHYDMDGDGKVDCPYDFKNKTTSKATKETTEVTHNNKADKKSSDTLAGILIFGIYVFLMFVLPGMLKR